MTSFPGGLPFPRATGAGSSLAKGAGRFETDAGPAIQWATTTAVRENLQLTYPCSAAQRDSLIDFFKGDAAMGGVWFDFTNPFNLADGQARFLVGQEPKQTPAPPKFEVSIVLEFVPDPPA